MAVESTVVVVSFGACLVGKGLLGRLWHMQRWIHAQGRRGRAGGAGGIGSVVVVLGCRGLGEGTEVVDVDVIMGGLRNAHSVPEERVSLRFWHPHGCRGATLGTARVGRGRLARPFPFLPRTA